MKNVCKSFLLYLLLTSQAFAATAQVNNVLNLGGVSVSNVSSNPFLVVPDNGQTKTGGYFTLYCGDTKAGLTSGSFYPCYKNGVAYAPPNGSTFKSAVACDQSQSTTINWQMVQDTGAAITYGQAGALTAGIFQAGATTRNSQISSPSANLIICRSITMSFSGVASFGQIAIQPNDSGNINVWIVGKEVTP